MKKLSFGMIYEVGLAILVILSLTLDLSTREGEIFDWIIWGIFVVDYAFRLIKSEKKWEFVYKHPLDFIAILPFSQILRSARFVRLIRVIRLIMIMNRRLSFLDQMMSKYKVDTLVITVISMLFLIALPMKWIEPSFDSYSDALWWAIVTMTTVGYGDLSPETTIGRIIASVLMLSGIGIIGIITGTVASIFTRSKDDSLPPELRELKSKIDRYPDLDDVDYDYMIGKLTKLQREQRLKEAEG
ncbi:potassium channel family protein [Paenibacillus sp. HB172176]|uniref:potassium channel family protein n=1 Tax=Paenibacillus sp. HB172176 TaxID=2493690 RepID=UPI00143A8C14|nr:potassium channel family protein [Paenibacillus sp. HB172176]